MLVREILDLDLDPGRRGASVFGPGGVRNPDPFGVAGAGSVRLEVVELKALWFDVLKGRKRRLYAVDHRPRK